jgi:hypothetical protein
MTRYMQAREISAHCDESGVTVIITTNDGVWQEWFEKSYDENGEATKWCYMTDYAMWRLAL